MRALRDYFSRFPAKRFEKDQIILSQGEVPKVMYVVKMGFVKGYDITIDGNERIVSYSRRGDILPLAWLFSRHDRAQYFLSAASTCELYLVPKDEFLEYLKDNSPAMMELCERMTETVYNMMERVVSMEQPKASDKILHTLKYLESNYGRSAGTPTTHVEVPMKVQDLSSMVGLTRETVGAEMKKLKKAGIITHKRWQFSIDREKLEELLSRPIRLTRKISKLAPVKGRKANGAAAPKKQKRKA